MSSGMLQAQTVILVNGEPKEVVLKETEIVEVLSTDVSDYLDGYDTTVPLSETRVQARQAISKIIAPLPALRLMAKREIDAVAIADEE